MYAFLVSLDVEITSGSTGGREKASAMIKVRAVSKSKKFEKRLNLQMYNILVSILFEKKLFFIVLQTKYFI